MYCISCNILHWIKQKRICCKLGHVHTYTFSCENGDFSVRFRLLSTRKRGLKVETFENGDFRKRRLSKTETFENAALSCGRAKTETFENGVDLKTYTCGRSLSKRVYLTRVIIEINKSDTL